MEICIERLCILNNLPLDFPYDLIGFEAVAVRSVYKELAISLVLTLC